MIKEYWNCSLILKNAIRFTYIYLYILFVFNDFEYRPKIRQRLLKFKMSYYDGSMDYSTNDTSLPPVYLFITSNLNPFIFVVISLAGLIGNGLVIFCLLYFTNLKTVPNVYILNLAVIDLFFLLGLPLMAYQYHFHDWPFGVVLCKFANGMDVVNQYGSAWTLVAMSADRFTAVVYPLSSMQRRTRSCARMVCTVVVVWSFVLGAFNWIFATVVSFQVDDSGKEEQFCMLDIPANLTSMHIIYSAFNFTFGFAIPLAAILFFYMSIFYIMQTNDFYFRSNAKTAAQRASKRVAVLTIAVIVVFFICWMPYYTVQFKLLLQDMRNEGYTISLSVIQQLSIALCYMNSLFNPFVYTFIGENFRKNLAKLFCYGARNLNRGRSGRDSSSYTRSTVKLQPLKRHKTKATYYPSDVTIDVANERNNNTATTAT